MTSTKNSLASDRSTVRNTLTAQASRVLSARNTAKNAATSNIAATARPRARACA